MAPFTAFLSTSSSLLKQEVYFRLNPLEQKAMLHAALAGLSTKERAAIALQDLEGCTTAEVAGILQSSEATVRSQIPTGRVKIKTFMTELLRRQGWAIARAKRNRSGGFAPAVSG